MTEARAVRVHEFGAPDALRLDTVPVGSPGPGRLRIDVAAAGLNFPDLLVAAGTYQSLPEPPFTLGMELSGTVAELGEGVEGFSVGDRVFALLPHGAFAESVIVDAGRVHPVPSAMSLVEAAGFGLAFATAYFALLRRGGLREGSTVLATGVSGGVGAAVAAIASARGARVIGATRNREAAERVVGDAVDVFVSADPAQLREEVLAATDGRGADLVIDVVGGEVLAQALRCVAWEGRLIVVGFASGDQPRIVPGHLLVKNIGVAGLQVTDYFARDPEGVRAAFRELGDDLAAGRIRIPVTATFPLESAAEALEALQRGEITGKAVLVTESLSENDRSQ